MVPPTFELLDARRRSQFTPFLLQSIQTISLDVQFGSGKNNNISFSVFVHKRWTASRMWFFQPKRNKQIEKSRQKHIYAKKNGIS